MGSDERHEREMHYRNRGFTRLGAREAVRRADILRGARRCRDGWQTALTLWDMERADYARALDERDAAIARAEEAERRLAQRCATCEHFVAEPMNYCREHGPGGFTPPSADWYCKDWEPEVKP